MRPTIDERCDERGGPPTKHRAEFTISRKNPGVLFLLLDALRRHDGNDDGGRRRREAPRLRSCIVRSLTQARESRVRQCAIIADGQDRGCFT